MRDVALSTGVTGTLLSSPWTNSAARRVQLVGEAGLVADMDSTQVLACRAAVSFTSDLMSVAQYQSQRGLSKSALPQSLALS